MSDTNDEQKQTFWQSPVTRGVMNGIVFIGLLMVMQVQGLFQEPRPLTEESIVQHVIAGCIFGYIMYVVEIWKRRRRTNAAKAARDTVQANLRDDDRDGGDDPREDRKPD